jgi:hypothetical protein
VQSGGTLRASGDDHPRVFKIDPTSLTPSIFISTGRSRARTTNLAFGGDFNLVQMAWSARSVKMDRFDLVWSCWVHIDFIFVRSWLGGCISGDRFEHAPDIFRQNVLPGGIRMDVVGQVQ